MSDTEPNVEPKDEEETAMDQRPLKIEDSLPVTAVGIENLKEANPENMSPHRRIYKWFARRPTAATRLAILSSVLPDDVSDDELLRLMCIGPKEGLDDKSIEDYVLQKQSTKDSRDGSVEDHFGYDYPHKNTPTNTELNDFHDTLKDHWDGDLPTVLDPTAGGGTIPMESARYGLPTFSNELHTVPWLINKVILEYSPSIGSLEEEVRDWMDDIKETVSEDLAEYFPDRQGVSPSQYFRTYSISCPSCGKPLPLSNKWWFNKRVDKAVQPYLDEMDNLKFKMVDVSGDTDFNPNEGTVDGGDAECPHCDVVTEREDIVEKFQNNEVNFEVGGVRYEQKINGTKYHSPTEEDYKAIEKAQQKVESDLELATLLATDRFEGRQDRAIPYGVTEWRDVYSPRQLLSHASFLQAFDEVKPEIREQYSPKKAEAILVLLSLVATKLIERNSRLVPLDSRRGSPANMLGNNNFAFQWHFGESNILRDTYSYQSEADNVLNNYEKLVEYFQNTDGESATVRRGDGSDLPIDDNSIESIVIDPPYGDNVIYSELADAFYVWLKEYLGDVFPEAFQREEEDKSAEAVENPQAVNPSDEISSSEAARQKYENKMEEIFSEAYRVLEPGGVMTIYFTEKQIDAWDSLTMSLINSGFTVTATHPVTSEAPQRIVMRDRASADTTLLLTCRKPLNPIPADERESTLWGDIKSETQEVAKEKVSDLLDSDLNLTKTDTIISAFGPTLRVFTENAPVVDKHEEEVRPRQALQEARTAVIGELVSRELDHSLDGVDNLTKWYILCWLVYEDNTFPHDEARQLGIGVDVKIDDIKRDTKIWSKSDDDLMLKGQDGRVQDFDKLKSGAKRRSRKYPIDPRDTSFDYDIDAVHAVLNILQTDGGNTAWNWLKDRNFHEDPAFKKVVRSLITVLPEKHDDYDLLSDLVVGETGELLNIDTDVIEHNTDTQDSNIEDYHDQ